MSSSLRPEVYLGFTDTQKRRCHALLFATSLFTSLDHNEAMRVAAWIEHSVWKADTDA